MDYLPNNNAPGNNGGKSMFWMLLLMATVFLVSMQFFTKQDPNAIKNQQQSEIKSEQTEEIKVVPEIKYEIDERTLETGALQVTLTNAGGGRISSVNIKDPDRYSEHGDFIRSQKPAVNSAGGLLPLEVTLPAFGIQKETQFKTISEKSDTHSASFSYVDTTGNLQVDKTFTLNEIADDSELEGQKYVMHARFTLTNRTSQAIADNMAIVMYIKQIEGEEPGMFQPGSYVAAKCYADGDMEYLDATDKDENESYDKSVNWFGVDESYFAMIMTGGEYAKTKCDLRNDDGLLKSQLNIPVAIEAGKSVAFDFDIFLGPKESRYLSTAFAKSDNPKADRDLPSVIDYGWMEVLARPMAWILDIFHELSGNWGIAIIILTLIVRIFLWPIAQKSQVSMMRMSKITPLMQELQEKYKDDQATLAQKQMELYKQYKINPFGCLPLLIQMPIFFALYRCIFVTGGLYHAEFYGWIHDLSAPDPYFILPVLSIALLLLQQLINPSTGPKKTQQKIMMYGMPIFFGIMMLFLPSGLCLYMVVSSSFSMIQSFVVRRKLANEDITASKEKDDKFIDVQGTSKDRRAAKRREK